MLFLDSICLGDVPLGWCCVTEGKGNKNSIKIQK